MSTMGTFDSFTTSRLGIYAAQIGLQVTGNNISNINTEGYTRQRTDQVSFKSGVNDRYASMMDNHIGRGALVRDINQIRDPYLDIRYRCTATDTAYYDTKLSGLQEIAAILDEVGKGIKDGDETAKGDGILYANLQDLAEKLRAFSADPTEDNDTLVRKSAETLCSMFNLYADKLEKLRQHTEEDFNINISKVNKILTNIRDLNKSIRTCEINGDNALEMRDERNRQIDELAQFMSIRVKYSMEDVGAGVMVEKLTILMGDSNPDPNVETDTSMLVDGLYCTQLSVPDKKPVLNPYKDMDPDKLTDEQKKSMSPVPVQKDADGKPDLAELKELNDYLFLAKTTTKPTGISNAYVRVQDVDKAGNTVGAPYYLVGTNDPTGEELNLDPKAGDTMLLEDNDNYTVQLGKLLDSHNEEWKSSETTWDKLTGGTIGTRAVYEYTFTTVPGEWSDQEPNPSTIEIAGKKYTVGAAGDYGIPLATVQDAAKLASFIADKLRESGNYSAYTITTQNNKVVFTAKEVGAVNGDQGPASLNLDLKPNDPTSKLTMETKFTDGQDSVPPNPDPAKGLPVPGETTDPFTGDKTTVRYVERSGSWYVLTVVHKETREIALDDNDLHGELQAQRELLTEEGEFASAKDIGIDENAAIKRGIPYYQKAFDLLAQTLANEYNKLNQGFAVDQEGYYIKEDGSRITFLDGTAVNKYTGLTKTQESALFDAAQEFPEKFALKDADGKYILDDKDQKIPDLNAWLESKGAEKMGGVLFSNRNDNDEPENITAANISVSAGWSHGATWLVPKFEKLFADANDPDGMEHTTKNINANHMVTLIDQALKYNPASLVDANGVKSDAVGPLLFEGSFNDMFSNMMGVQAKDASMTNVKLTTSYTTLVSLDSAREGVSGVDLNDEAMNMLQYQKAMNAAMRLMTAIDEALDRLINNTGVAGR